MNYRVEKNTDRSSFYYFKEPNQIGETLVIEFYKNEMGRDKHSLPHIWFKEGLTDHLMECFWSVITYVHTEEGECLGIYNPQVTVKETLSGHGYSQTLDFTWILDATEENRQKIIDEVWKRFISPDNIRRDMEKTKEYYSSILSFAADHQMGVMTSVPDGFEKVDYGMGYLYTPRHSEWFSNGKPFGAVLVIDGYLAKRLEKYGIRGKETTYEGKH